MRSSPVYSPFTALILKIVGLILIVSSLLDLLILSAPYNLVQRDWQMAFTNQLVDRGIIPLIGISLFFVGYLVDSKSSPSETEQKSVVQNLRFWVLLLSSLLGLIYLLLVPLHINNIVQKSDEAFKQVNQKATQTESQVEIQLKTQAQQVDALVKDPKRFSETISQLDKAIASGQLQGDRLTQAQTFKSILQAAKQNPQAIPQALNQQIEANRVQIQKGKQDAENQAKTDAVKLGLRTGLNSLFLAIGYITIGWTGLRGLGNSSASRSKV
jgi:hypothetical protein